MATTTKTLVAAAVALFVAATLIAFVYSVDLSFSQFFPFPSSSAVGASRCGNAGEACRRPPPLRVYMYDLPPRFNIGMFGERLGDGSRGGGFPPWPMGSGIKRQHSVEYWMMGSLMDGGAERTEDAEAVRVFDGDQAEVFFVPFFSSLSFNTHGHNMTDPDTKIDRQLQGEQLGKTYEGIVRFKLAKLLKGFEDVHYEDSYATGEGIRSSTQGMRSSKFCLHPAGDTPSSCRLFDAIVSHCVPVIVSDRIELPFEDVIDYSQFSVFFSVQEALQPGYMVSQLRNIQKEKWLEMWRTLKNVSHYFEFQLPTKKDDAVNMLWQQIHHKVPTVKLAVHRSKRLRIPDWWSRR